MTGPAPGKVSIRCDKVVIKSRAQISTIRPDLYIHVKGYSLARVTHIDVEYPELEKMLSISYREVLPAILSTQTRDYVLVIVPSRELHMSIYSEELREILPRNYRGGCVVGGKVDGIFIGVKREVIKYLEEFASSRGYPPRSKHLKESSDVSDVRSLLDYV
ncbi:MAG: hypothetical protein DRJ40_09695 [Thermoprotei archaeon]|nr:MAG: hypothetical protein DRJ40_09695 [Thermoprotei archaeon]